MSSTIDKRDTVPIPGPRGYPIVGNVADIDPAVPLESLANLADQYGPIYSLTTFGTRRVIISSVEYMEEVCDEKRFSKVVKLALEELRHGTHDGLFTAHTHEHNWELAHRILVPAFGPLSIRGMFDDMKDIASQLILKLARYGPQYHIPVADDFTRLTLDTLALCAMDFRFNSFYQDQMHPFIGSMTNFLKESGDRTRRAGFMAPFYRAEEMQYQKDIDYMRNLSDELIQERQDHPKESKDLLNAMINGKDPQTGEGLSRGTIIDNMITFLIAGHETTSGLLSFVFYYLLKHPAVYKKAQEEVDSVVGTDSIQVEHLNKLPYINAILRETLRLQPTAPAISLTPKGKNGELVGGKYYIEHDEPIVALLAKTHRDPAVYGHDSNEWKPERMLDEPFKKLPPNAWKPFGNGMRGCIGRPFAWQEALLVTAMLLQYFNFAPEDPSYTLQIKQTLTIKPKDFYMRATLRDGLTATKIERTLSGSIREPDPKSASMDKAAARTSSAKSSGVPITVLYGSNSGTCEAFAQRLAADAAAHGFQASKVDTLDSATQTLPSDQPVVIITASYEGAPCDNAAHFYHWLEAMKEDEKVNLSYAVFGAGHSDWKATFHRIPNAIDAILAEHGGKRICDRGKADAASGDMFSDFDEWEDNVFWPAVKKQYGGDMPDSASAAQASSTSFGLSIEVSNRRAARLRADVSEARVIATSTLTAPGVPEKRHMEIKLPSEMTYRAGDYLAILPLNPQETVHRVMKRFGLAWDSMLTISSKTGTTLPTDAPISAHNVFSAYVELSQPATKRNVAMLVEASKDEATRKELQEIADARFTEEISNKRVSLLDLLERYPSVELPLGAFVASLISMRVRQYSISSSPLANPHHVTLTYAVLDQPSMSGQGRYVGVASNYLSKLQPGDTLHVSVRPSNQAFHLPIDAEKVPVVMVAAGTGLAPFRGFVQERAAQVGAGRSLAPAVLFFGCRDPEQDDLYRSELSRWEQMGAVQVIRAYSKKTEASNGFKYVQDALWANKHEALDLWDKGSRVFVCGSREVGEAVKDVCLRMRKEKAEELGKDQSDEAGQKWFESIRNDRYSTDVFA